MMKKYFICFLMSVLCISAYAQKVRVAADQGIKGDGTTLNTEAIQRAVDAISAKGGGVLKFTPGVYKTGCIILKSGVELNFDRGAVLSGSTDPEHYKSLIASEAKDNSTMALIVADGASNIAITGAGRIDGNGRALALAIDSLIHINPVAVANPRAQAGRQRPGEPLRPKLFFMSNCDNVRVEDLTLRNSACWGLSFHSCRNVSINGIDFINRAYWNNDGIDLTDCKHVHVSNCNIDSADDGICLKSYDTTSCNEDILIEDCTVCSSASAVKFGTASWGGFKNVTVRNIKVYDTYRSAIALESVDGGVLDGVLVENVHAVNTGNPIFIRLGHRAGDAPGAVRNITIRNVFVEMPFDIPDIDHDIRGPGFSVFNPRPSSITGIPGHDVENVLLENIEIVYPGRASTGIAYYPLTQIDQVPERINSYPEFSMFGDLPAWAFYLRHVNGVSMKNVHLSLRDEDFRPAFIFDDAKAISLEKVALPFLTSGSNYYQKESSFVKNCLD